MKNVRFALVIPIFLASLLFGVAHTGCNTQPEPGVPDALTSVESEIGGLPFLWEDPPPSWEDPPPPWVEAPSGCVRSCAGKRCGESDGCGRWCSTGSCPTGQTCGGGGSPGICGCSPQCTGKACGESDGCGGTCDEGTCPAYQTCSLFAPGECGGVKIGQSVECFVFDDGYSSMAGPSGAIYFATDGKACIPDATSTGTCRKWWGRCRTTDASHTPVMFRAGYEGIFETKVAWSGPSDAIYSKHYYPLFNQPESRACLPDATAEGDCDSQYFGNAQTEDGRAVRCRLFNDGGRDMIGPTDYMYDRTDRTVTGAGLKGAKRKWFGECTVGGCGDGVCDPNESMATCSDCTCGNGVCDGFDTPTNCATDCVRCGDGVCNGGENATSCASDCARCGDGVCNGGENASSCPGDCARCGDGVCNGGETCSSCSFDCACPKTCSGAPLGATGQFFTVYWEDAAGCVGVSNVVANNQREAHACISPFATVQTTPPIEYWFHITPPDYNCRDIGLAGFSTEGARRCAKQSSGIDFQREGPCP